MENLEKTQGYNGESRRGTKRRGTLEIFSGDFSVILLRSHYMLSPSLSEQEMMKKENLVVCFGSPPFAFIGYLFIYLLLLLLL